MTALPPDFCRYCSAPLEPGQEFCSRCGASTTLATAGEDPLRDRLEKVFGTELVIEREVGRGAMGAVFAAFDPALRRRVAVKALLPEVESDPAVSVRFIREARISAALQHQHIVSVYGVRSGDGVRAIVMQYVEGRGLNKVLADMPSMPVPSVAKILAEVAAALQHAHERGVVHRDVKPANILLGNDGRAIVTDFGIARQFGTTHITEQGLVMGTIPYVSPEAATGHEATAASDQYALGIVAFEMLAGRRPFTGTAQTVLMAHVRDAPPSLAEARPDLPPVVVQAVHRMLEKVPDARWPHLTEVERVFRGLITDPNAAIRQLSQLSQAVPQPDSKAPSVVRPVVAAPTTRQRGALVASALVIVAAAVAGGVWITRLQSAPAPELQVSAPRSAQQPATVATAPVIVPPPVVADSTVRQATPAARAGSVQQRVIAPQVATPPIDSAATLRPPVKPVPPPPPDEPPKPATRAEAAIVAAKPAAEIADARRLGNEFVARVNQRRWRELEALPATGGDSTARATLIRIVRGTADIAAGFSRMPSISAMTADGFESEFMLDLEVTTRGRTASATYTIVVRGAHDGSGWHLAGWRVESAP